MKKQSINKEYCIVIISFIILTAFLTYPMIFRLDLHYILNKKDYLFNIWNLWWGKDAALNQHIMPYQTDYLFHPSGTTIAFHSMNMYNSLASIPFQFFLSLTSVYNILFLLSFILSAFGAYLLIKYMTENKIGAFIGGIIFAFSPLHLEEYARLNVATIQWIPFFCLFFMKMIREGGIKNSIFSAIFLFLIALSFWEYFIYTLFLILIILFYNYKKTLSNEFMKYFSITVLISFVLIIPFMLPLLKVLVKEGEYLYAPISSHAQLLGMMPSKHFGLYLWPVILGYTSVSLFIYSVFRNKTRETYLWLLIVSIFFILALGPYLIINKWEFSNIILPFALIKKIPFIQIVRTPHRSLVMVTLGMAVMSGFAISKIVSGKYGTVKFIVLLLILIFEYAAIPKQSFSLIKVPHIYKTISNEQENIAIIDVPLNDFGGAYSIYYQTFHKKKLVGGYTARIPDYSKNYIRSNPLLNKLSKPTSFFRNRLTSNEIEYSLRSLEENRIKYLIIHKYLMIKKDSSARKKVLRTSFIDMLLPYSLQSKKIKEWRGKPEIYDYKESFSSQSEFNALVQEMNIIFDLPIYEDEKIVVYQIF